MVASGRGQAEGSEGEAALAGDRLRALFDEHYRALVKLASFYLDEVAACEEVVQDAFVRLLDGRRPADPAKAAPYLRSAVLNGARSQLRKREVRRRPWPRPAAPPELTPEASAIAADEQARVLGALRQLPDRQADVLTLRYWMELSEAEIAETLGISTGSVKTHAYRGIARLAVLLGEEDT